MKKVSILLAMLLSGCTFMNVQDLGDDKYNLIASTSAFNSNEAARNKMEEKAKKLCGENNYHFIGEEGTTVNKEYTGNVAATSKFVTRTLQCGNPQ